MKISKLYLKIFLSFLTVLIVAEVVLFGIFLSGRLPEPLIRNVVEKAVMTRALITREIGDAQFSPQTLRERLAPLVNLLGKGFGTKIWLMDAAGFVVVKNFEGKALPPTDDLNPIEQKISESVRLFTLKDRNHRSIFMKFSLRLHDGTQLTCHMFLHKRPHKEEEWFLKGLMLLTLLGALLIIPVSRTITRPILRLSEAADRLGQGDFSQRAPEKGGDEVAVLARKFNTMAQNLEKMVMSGKELTANLSHELRSPLARMRVSLQLLLEQTGEEHAAFRTMLLSKMQGEIENMDTLIGNILALSKLDMREPPPRNDKLDVSARIQSLLDSYGPMLAKQHLSLATDLHSTPPLLCHAHSISILLDNVLNNAIKYTADGGTISVRLQAGEDMLQIKICNPHPPLVEKDLSDMFQPFHRLDKGKMAGTGLGLATAKKIVTLHEGSIHAAYESGNVCIFIKLPTTV